MSQYTHEEAVRLLRVLDAERVNHHFAMGDIALDQYPMSEGHTNTGTGAGLRTLAEETGIEYETLDIYRRVAARVPEGRRLPSVTWSVYQEIALSKKTPAEQAALFRKLQTEDPKTESGRWTVNAIRQHLGKASMGRKSDPLVERVEQAPLVERVAVLDTLLADSEVRQEVRRQEAEEGEQRTKASARAKRSDSVLRTLDALRAKVDLEKLFDGFIKGASKVLPRLDPVGRKGPPGGEDDPWATAYFLRSRIAAVRGVCDQVEALMDTGRVGGDIDAFYKRVLSESKPKGG